MSVKINSSVQDEREILLAADDVYSYISDEPQAMKNWKKPIYKSYFYFENVHFVMHHTLKYMNTSQLTQNFKGPTTSC